MLMKMKVKRIGAWYGKRPSEEEGEKSYKPEPAVRVVVKSRTNE